NQYQLMADAGELFTIGDQTVPIKEWIAQTMELVAGCPVECIVADRYKKAEVGEALAANKVRARVAWNGMGWRDGAEAVRRFQRAVLDHKLRAEKSTLMVSALSNCVVVLDEAGNAKISK